MSGRIPREFIDDLLVRVDIVDLIDSFVPLKKTGSNFMARCPFHTEKTPSFSVSRKKQFYHCFGCGASGNAISFLMDYNHLDFVEAIEDLAAFAGVDVPREKSGNFQPKQDLSSLYETLEKAASHYQSNLHGADGQIARQYLKQRGVSDEISQTYQLGYALDRWDDISKRLPHNPLMETGMLVQNENGRTYDRFRNRLMFPIRDKRGRVIGFGGRVFDDSTPKYLNSPETPVFSKGNELYGLHEALQQTSRPERFIIVEGYMDVIALAQHGIPYAVATLGTATSQKHISTLFRFSTELVLCFDGDSAGQQAAWRAMEAVFPVLKDNCQVKIMLLPEQEDPDSLIRHQGLAHMQHLVETATPLSEYFFSTLKKDLDLNSLEGRAALAAKARPYLQQLPPGFFRDMMFSEIQKITATQTLATAGKSATLNRNRQKSHARPSPARIIIALLLQNPEFAQIIEKQSLDWENLTFPGAPLFRDIFQNIQVKGSVNTAMLLESFRDTEHAETVKKLTGLEIIGHNQEQVFCDALKHLLRQETEQRLTQLLEKGKKEKLTPEEKQTLSLLLKQKLTP